MKRSRRLAVVLVAILVGLALIKNEIAKVAVINGVKAVTGLGVSIDHLDLGLLTTRVSVKGVKVLNPKGFDEPVMVSIPELYVDYDVGAVLKGKTHLELVRLQLDELTVVKNAEGRVNLHSLTVVKEQQKTPSQKPATKPSPLLIDLLELQIGRVVYKDYSKGVPPTVRAFNVNINERYEHVRSPQALGSMILVRALAKTTIAQAANLDLGGLRETASRGIHGLATGLLDSTIGGKGAATLKSLLLGEDASTQQ